MEALAYRKNAVMVREAVEPGRPLPGRETRAPPQRVHPRQRAGTEEYLWLCPVGRPELCYRLFWVSFQFCGLEAALGEELFFRSRRDVGVNLTRIKEFKPCFKSDSGSS